MSMKIPFSEMLIFEKLEKKINNVTNLTGNFFVKYEWQQFRISPTNSNTIDLRDWECNGERAKMD